MVHTIKSSKGWRYFENVGVSKSGLTTYVLEDAPKLDTVLNFDFRFDIQTEVQIWPQSKFDLKNCFNCVL